MTLAEVRAGVFAACTLNTNGDRGARALQIVDQMIRRSQRELELKAPWLRLSATRTITLTDAVDTYDFPDDLDPGRILDVFVRNASTLKFYPLNAAPSQRQRNAGSAVTSGRPFWYWYDNEVLNITPAPLVASWDQLRLDGYLRASALVNDEDLASVDGEALIQRAEIHARPRIGLPVTQDMKDSHLAYLRDVAASQTEAGSVIMGGDTSARCMPQDGEAGSRQNYAWDESWNPPGFPPL
jgi:hypothetical protein